MRYLFNRTAHVFTFITFFLLSGLSFADGPDLVPVGFYDNNGNIQLSEEMTYVTHFPSGQPVEEFGLKVVNDFVYLSRKGYTDEGDCFTELAPLVDGYGEQVSVGSDPAACKFVYITEARPIELVSCKDDGCHMLVGVVPPNGGPVITGARCDSTELSNHHCSCHINRGLGAEVIKNTSFCKSVSQFSAMNYQAWLAMTSSQLNQAAAKIHPIDHCIQQ